MGADRASARGRRVDGRRACGSGGRARDPACPRARPRSGAGRRSPATRGGAAAVAGGARAHGRAGHAATACRRRTKSRRIYKQTWFWAVAAVVGLTAVMIVYGLSTQGPATPSTDLGNMRAY